MGWSIESWFWVPSVACSNCGYLLLLSTEAMQGGIEAPDHPPEEP